MLIIGICFASNALLVPKSEQIHVFPKKHFVWRWLCLNYLLTFIFFLLILPVSKTIQTYGLLLQVAIIIMYLIGLLSSERFKRYLWGANIPRRFYPPLSLVPLINTLACFGIFFLLPHTLSNGHPEFFILAICLLFIPAITPTYLCTKKVSLGNIIFLVIFMAACILCYSMSIMTSDFVQSSFLGKYTVLITTPSLPTRQRLKQLCPEQQYGFACWVVFNAQNKLYLSRDANDPHWESFNKTEVNFHWLKPTTKD